MQWFGKHVSTIEAVFSVGSVQRSYLKYKRRYSSVLRSEFTVEESHGKFIEDLKCDLKPLCVLQCSGIGSL
jgi:hypothetical protein